jgi:hypothetical protein
MTKEYLMRKALVGIVAAVIIIGTGAYFGSDLLAQFRTKSQVEAVFDSLRATFSTASHGRIELYSKTRSVKISNIILQSNDRATTIKIGQLVAVGTKEPVAGRVSAGRIEITNWEVTTAVPIAAGPAIAYKAPNIVIESFTGPATFPQKVNPTSMIDVMRGCLEYVAASTAKAITIPKLSASVTPKQSDPATPSVGPVEYTYSDIAFRDIGDRRIASISVERTTVTSDAAVPELGSVAAAMARMSLSDLNLGTAVAIFDPNKAKDDGYLPLYRQASMGPFEMRFAQGASFQMDAVTIDDIGIRPSKLSIINFLSLADSSPTPGAPPSPAQLRIMMDQVAYMYEGMRISKFEMRGIKTRMTPDTDFKFGAVRMSGLENGRLAEFVVEGLDGQSPQKDPIHIGRFAFKGLQIANFIRQSVQMADMGRAPPPDQALGLLALLEGIELSDVKAKNGPSQQEIRIDNFQLSWSQFVGPIPTIARLTAKTSVPSNLADSGMGGMLADAGLPTVSTNLDIGVAWTEATNTLVISPTTIELENVFSFSASLSIQNVPRSMFSVDPSMAMMAAEQLEAGPIQLSLRDTGGVTTALAQYAKSKNLSVDDARKEIIESVNATVNSTAQSNPDAASIAQAIVQFIEAPGSTLTINVTPKGRVNFKQAFTAGAADPTATASLFTIEAKTTK